MAGRIGDDRDVRAGRSGRRRRPTARPSGACPRTLPYGSWLEVSGHFDDPAAAGCVRGWTPDEADSISPETAAEQVFSCREQFVITAVRPVAAP
ncbi:MAG TPA: hypothetical protein VHM48_07515 [Candidatus Limnocylindrales bacterium]|nr:hypothetical protein [Candidatus Limnocylindrales bacterium]